MYAESPRPPPGSAATVTDAPVRRPAVRDHVALGIAMMLLGDFLFSANDAMGKWLVATYTVGQVLLIRSGAALLVMAPMIHRAGWRILIPTERPWTQVSRVALSIVELIAFYAAAVHLPIADVMTFYLAGPIYVAALSPWLLGERVGWRRWTAIAVGFVGVLIALKPSPETLSAPALISIFGSFAFALIVIQSRQLRNTPDLTLVFWQTAGAFAAGLVIAPFSWVPPTPRDWGLLAALGVVAMVAHLCINRALKLAPAAVVAPFQYTLLIWALVFGWTVFGDVPKTDMLIGGVIIVGAGLFIFERQKKVAPEAAETSVQDVV
ncbi:permease [Oharaeibacter diazotrophicus]|nr:permease [Oharaeibacter diazotrophicus]